MPNDTPPNMPPNADLTPDRPALRPWLRVVLFTSLALNLAVVGLAAGAVFSGGAKHGRDSARDAVDPYMRAFNDSQRDDLRRQLRQAFEDQRGGPRQAILSNYSDAVETLRATPFDPDRLSQLLEAQGSQSLDRRRIGKDVMVSYLAAMTPSDRSAFADRLEASLSEWGKRDWRRN